MHEGTNTNYMLGSGHNIHARHGRISINSVKAKTRPFTITCINIYFKFLAIILVDYVHTITHYVAFWTMIAFPINSHFVFFNMPFSL